MKRLYVSLFLILMPFVLTSCAAWDEMGQTGEPPTEWVNRYRAMTKIVTEPKPIREVWNYGAGFIGAATGGGIDLVVEDPE